MKKSLYSIPIVIVAVIAIGYVFTRTNTSTQKFSNSVPSNTPSQTQTNSNPARQHGHEEDHAKLAGTRIDLQNATNLKPGEVTLAFKLYGADAHEFGPDDLKIAHEKLMHLIVVRDDMTGFQHLHPGYQDGRWTVKTNPAEQGAYQMYVDIHPKEESPVTLRVPLTIGGKTLESQFPEVSANMSSIVNGFQVALESSTPLKTREHTTLTFAVTQQGKPVTRIDPYLGAFGHAVVLRHGDADDFIHAHPITETKPTDGTVVFESEFPTKGTYTLFAQFSINGQVRTFPITVSVESEGQAPADHENPTNAHTGEKSNSGH